ncbi:efflux RND transporter periplasmic adaptor subunit [Oxalobacteraceae bacterium A2-2]
MQKTVFRSPQTLLGLTAIAIAAAVVVTGLSTRHLQAEQLQQGASEHAVPTVNVVSASPVDGAALELPARIEPWSRAPIYARVSGYLKRWNVDIGGAVKAGQVLAEIETPDQDQQLAQARADLVTARSNLALSASTAKRWEALLASNAVSKQEADEKAGDLAAKQSVVNGLQANVERLQAVQRYARLTAPFDGVVTARNTDVGALISVGGAAGTELFVVSDVKKLRIYVSVPQSQVGLVKAGSTARITVPERPGKSYTATVQSTSQAISAGTGAMLVQLVADNASGELLPGGFATASFDTKGQAGLLAVPPGALMLGKNGTRVATVGADNRVQIKPVQVARDYGNVIALGGGVSASDRVIDSPPDGLANGDLVRIATTQKSKP